MYQPTPLQDDTPNFSVISQQDNITFWSRQISEHMLFFHLGLEDKGLKETGKILHDRWEKFRNFYQQNPKDAEFNYLPNLVIDTGNYKLDVLTRLQSGEWLGWIFPLFADHVIREMNYFIHKHNNTSFSALQETEFWNEINADHAAFEAHLLDPSAENLIIQAKDLKEMFKTLAQDDLNQFIMLSIMASEELGKFQGSARSLGSELQAQSIINPVLLDHVIRENMRSVATLRGLVM